MEILDSRPKGKVPNDYPVPGLRTYNEASFIQILSGFCDRFCPLPDKSPQ